MARLSSSDAIRVEGLTELNRALRTMGPEFQKELKQANMDVAQFVADDVQAAAFSIGGVAAKTAPSIAAKAGTAWAGVSLGSAPYAAGAAFGGQGRPTTMQFKPWRREGYLPYPQIKADGPRIEHEYNEALDDLLKRNGLA